jgi:hypothetical protein
MGSINDNLKFKTPRFKDFSLQDIGIVIKSKEQ